MTDRAWLESVLERVRSWADDLDPSEISRKAARGEGWRTHAEIRHALRALAIEVAQRIPPEYGGGYGRGDR